MHHLVMGERQDEILAEGIEQAEGHVVVVMSAVDRIARHILQRVVHEAHVPFEAEAQPAVMDRAGDAGPGGRFLRHVKMPGC